MGDEQQQYRLKFITGDADILLMARPSDPVGTLVRQVRELKGFNRSSHIRIICAGKEMYSDESLSKVPSNVLHLMVSDVQPPNTCLIRPAALPKKPRLTPPPPPPVMEQPPVDWLDVVDPGTVLMWIFGSILALLWLLYVFYAHMYDRTSVVMLVMMTIAFLIPCILSYFPMSIPFSLSYPPPQAQHRPAAPAAPAATHDVNYIPPRPQAPARVRAA